MQMPTQGPALRRRRRLHPALGRFAVPDGIVPNEMDIEDMDEDDDGDDSDDAEVE